MDNKYALGQAAVVLFNPHLYMRTMLRSTLMGLGFKDVFDYGELDRTRDAIIERAPDLVLLDLDEEKEKTCNLIREIRQTNISENPFVAIIALS
ncbi:MAG: CheY-like chemotaxis protein [Alphaproteobacteria bacterium]